MKPPHRPRSRILETLRPQERVAHVRGRVDRVKARLLSIPAGMLVLRTIRELGNDDATHMAAGVAFYAILSLFPMTLGLVALLSVFLDSSSVQTQLLAFFQDYLPGVNDALETNINNGTSVSGFLGVLSFLGLFWSASAVFGAISRAVNRAWDVHQDRSFVVAKLRHIAMALGVGLLFLLSVGATTAIQFLGRVDLPGVGRIGFLENARHQHNCPSPAFRLLLYHFRPHLQICPEYSHSLAVHLARSAAGRRCLRGQQNAVRVLPRQLCRLWESIRFPGFGCLPCWCGHTCLP